MIVVAVLALFFGVLLVVGTAGSLPRVQRDDWAFSGVMGFALVACSYGAVVLIADKVVVLMVEGQIVHQHPFRGERPFHVFTVARVAPTPITYWHRSPGIGLYDVDGRPLLEMTGVWRGTDQLLAWLVAGRPDDVYR